MFSKVHYYIIIIMLSYHTNVFESALHNNYHNYILMFSKVHYIIYTNVFESAL